MPRATTRRTVWLPSERQLLGQCADLLAGLSPACSAQGANEHKKPASQWLVQGGIAKNWFGIGNTALYGEYGKANDWGALTGGTGRDYPVGSNFTAPFNTPYINSNNFLGIQNVTDTEVKVFGFGIVHTLMLPPQRCTSATGTSAPS